MLVSKYPFLDVHFYKFKGKGTKVWMKLLDYGIIMAKVDLGNDSKSGRRRVGYFANLHMMAYQVRWLGELSPLFQSKIKIFFVISGKRKFSRQGDDWDTSK